jgi:hypothetical protein
MTPYDQDTDGYNALGWDRDAINRLLFSVWWSGPYERVARRLPAHRWFDRPRASLLNRDARWQQHHIDNGTRPLLVWERRMP